MATSDMPPPATEGEPKPWWKRWWGIALIIFGVLVAISAMSGGTETTDGDPVASESAPEADPTEPASEPTEPADDPTEPAATSEPAPETEPGFGDGTLVVGEEVQPGTYRSTEETTLCYWARLAGFSGEMDDIIANGNNSPEIVTIEAGDAGFEAQGCGRWLPVEDTLPGTPATEFVDGTYQVGGHIEPGTYRADGDSDDLCYWARLGSFTHSGVDGIITNGNSPTTIEISDSDAGFSTFGCGTWTKAG